MAKLTEAELKKQIKSKQFSPAYVIYGDEQMFVKRYTEMLVQAVAGKNPSDFNFHSFSGEVDLDELAATMQIIPFMSEYNCVLVSDIFFDNMDKDDTDRFIDIISNTYEGTILIISMPSYQPSKKKASLTSVVKKSVRFVNLINSIKLCSKDT